VIYAQIKGGNKLHLACEAGEEFKGEVLRKGFISAPICGTKWPGRYRMTCNVPLAHACRNCCRVARTKTQ
jgi:hypothetical protein